jgi:pimeloyl-ACP methyl ester carboxylesterase
MVAKPHSAWMDIDWQKHLRWVEVDGIPANLVDVGEGPPLVFVHGLSGSWQNWLEQLPDLSRDHRCIAVDLPGFGESAMPRDKITISGYGRWLNDLFDVLEIDGAAVVGNSMGGFIAAETAIKFPKRVERLVLVAAAGLSIEHQRNEPVLRGLELAETLIEFGLAFGLARSRALMKRPRGRKALLWGVAAHPDDFSPALVSEQLKGTPKKGFLPALDALSSYPIRDRLGDIGCPTLIVWGPKDRLVPVKDAHEFDELIPDSRLLIYDDTGHVPMLERPERFNADLRAFLSEQPDSGRERVSEAEQQQEPEPAGVDADR